MKLIKYIFLFTFCIISCNRLDKETKNSLINEGFSENAIGKIQEMGYDAKLINALISFKKVGAIEDDCFMLADYLKQRNSDSLVNDVQTLLSINTTPNLIIQLIDNKSIPIYTDDIFAMKQEKLSDNLVLKISENMVNQKAKTTGYNYAVLRTRGYNDDQILKFIEQNGTQKEIDYIRQDIALGISADEALKRAFEPTHNYDNTVTNQIQNKSNPVKKNDIDTNMKAP